MQCWNQGQMQLQQMKMPFKGPQGLQLGKMLNFNPQVGHIIFILTFLLWKISKDTKVQRTFKESSYINHPVSTITSSRLILCHLPPHQSPDPYSTPHTMSSQFS